MLTIYGVHEQNTISQMHETIKHGSVVSAALCADGHLGYAHPIGGVVAYENHISLSGVGFDIACGCMAVRLDLKGASILSDLPKIAHEITRSISFGIGQKNNRAVDHDLFDDNVLWNESQAMKLKDMARGQLGTVGGGNHYVDILFDEDDWVWIGVHFGSRGLGHKMTKHFMGLIDAKDAIHAPPALMQINTPTADSYLALLDLAGKYAYAGREWVVDTVRRNALSGATVTKTVHMHHNFAWQEEHNGRRLYVVRKGATPCFPDQECFVGGSMGDDAVILKGKDTEQSRNLMYSTIHGAGRVMGRNQAKKTFTYEQMNEWLTNRGVIVKGGDLDESPMAYRRLDDVLEHHKDTVEITHRLMPVVVCMAGKRDYDPYKD